MSWFFLAWWDSLTDLKFYQNILGWSGRRTILFATLSCLLLGALATSRWYWRELPIWRQDLQESSQLLLQHYPPDLQITWDGHQLTTNQPAEIVVPFSPQAQTTRDFPFTNLARITKEAVTLPNESLATDTQFIITPTQLLMSDWAGAWMEVPLTDVPGFAQPFTITQHSLPEQVQLVTTTGHSLLDASTVVMLFGQPILIWIGLVWQSLFNGLLLLILLKLFGRHGNWKKLWQLAVHILLVAELIHQLDWLIYGQPHFWLHSLVFWVLIGFWWLGQVGYPYPLGGKR